VDREDKDPTHLGSTFRVHGRVLILIHLWDGNRFQP